MRLPLYLSVCFLFLTLISHTCYAARDYINVVGSSTVYPFSTVVAERFGQSTRFKTPKIESTGSGGGLKLFCQGVGVKYPDITNASRRIKLSEFSDCKAHGVTEIIEVLVGFDGIVLGNSATQKEMHLTHTDLFLALAKEVPNPNGDAELIANPYRTWQQVNSELPDRLIEVFGPPPTSGTRDAFVELVLQKGCTDIAVIKSIVDRSIAPESLDDETGRRAKVKRYLSVCQSVREDGRFVEAGENDNLILQKLISNPNALGIFGFSFLDQNADRIQGARIDGYLPTFASISAGDYPVSRPLYFYAKKAHVGVIPGMHEYLLEFTSDRATSIDGYLSEKGMIPLSEEFRQAVKHDVLTLKSLAL